MKLVITKSILIILILYNIDNLGQASDGNHDNYGMLKLDSDDNFILIYILS